MHPNANRLRRERRATTAAAPAPIRLLPISTPGCQLGPVQAKVRAVMNEVAGVEIHQAVTGRDD